MDKESIIKSVNTFELAKDSIDNNINENILSALKLCSKESLQEIRNVFCKEISKLEIEIIKEHNKEKENIKKEAETDKWVW